MNGIIALVGSGEYLPIMNDINRHLLATVSTNGSTPRVVCMPTVAGKEGTQSVDRWLTLGVEHFQALGADVTPARIIDRKSVDDPGWESVMENADLIYFSGGNPTYLYETMQGSRAWGAAQKAWGNGTVYLYAVRRQLRDDQFIIGVDENTALVGNLRSSARVMGQGQVHIITRESQQDFSTGQEVPHTI